MRVLLTGIGFVGWFVRGPCSTLIELAQSGGAVVRTLVAVLRALCQIHQRLDHNIARRLVSESKRSYGHNGVELTVALAVGGAARVVGGTAVRHALCAAVGVRAGGTLVRAF